MNNIHPIMADALAPFVQSRSLNDDDIYLIDVRTRTVVRHVSNNARATGFHVGVGQALLTGMQAKFMADAPALTRLQLLQLALMKYRAPNAADGFYVYEWHCDRLDEPMVCHLEYTASEAPTDICQGHRENLDLMYVYLRGLDVYGLLSSEDVEEIELGAMDQMRREAEQLKEPT